MNQNQLYKLNTPGKSRSVIHPIEPVKPFQSVPGFFNIAHRGASSYAPENTFPSFEKAVELKADMIELDVTLTRDKVPVVIHDSKLNRTTNGEGFVQNFYDRELRELDAGDWYGPEYKGTGIPRLGDVLKWASGAISLNIEIKKEAVKKDHKDGIVQLVHELIVEHSMAEQVIISSFNKVALERCWKINADISTAYLIHPYALGTAKACRVMKRINAKGLNMKPHQMRHGLMDITKKNRVPVWVYTVDDEDEMARVIKKGATGIFTNKPDVLGRVASAVLSEHQQ